MIIAAIITGHVIAFCTGFLVHAYIARKQIEEIFNQVDTCIKASEDILQFHDKRVEDALEKLKKDC
jgi:hypothetical protein